MDVCWKCHSKGTVQEPVCGWCEDGELHSSCDDSWHITIECDACSKIEEDPNMYPFYKVYYKMIDLNIHTTEYMMDFSFQQFSNEHLAEAFVKRFNEWCTEAKEIILSTNILWIAEHSKEWWPIIYAIN